MTFSPDGKEGRSSASKDEGGGGSEGSSGGPTALSAANVRILSRDHLQLVKAGALPRAPDCFQRTPKRVALQQADTAQVLALNIDGKGVHAVVKQGDKTYYRLFNVSTGKPDLDSRFPTDTTAFLGKESNQTRILTKSGLTLEQNGQTQL